MALSPGPATSKIARTVDSIKSIASSTNGLSIGQRSPGSVVGSKSASCARVLLCTLVMIGVTADGTKELVALEDGYRESTESWASVLRDPMVVCQPAAVWFPDLVAQGGRTPAPRCASRSPWPGPRRTAGRSAAAALRRPCPARTSPRTASTTPATAYTSGPGFNGSSPTSASARVGVVRGLEVSRLARNSSDWHRLLGDPRYGFQIC